MVAWLGRRCEADVHCNSVTLLRRGREMIIARFSHLTLLLLLHAKARTGIFLRYGDIFVLSVPPC